MMPALRTFCYTCLGVLLLIAKSSADSWTPLDVRRFFIEPGKESLLVWNCPPESKPASVPYRIIDYSGELIQSGEGRLVSERVEVKVNLPRGYYDIELGGERFGIVSQEIYTRSRDSFFGIDAVLTWLDRRPAMREAMVHVLKRCGVAMARERINWTQIEPKAGEFNWQERDQAWELRQLYQQEELPVLEMFHSAGPARGTFPVKNSYPQNLSLLAQSWETIHDQFRKSWGGFEVWNEPEGPYGSYLPADQYMTLVKAMRYAWQEHGIESPLGGGVFIGGDPGVFHDYCVRNGLLDLVDFVSFHDYKPATKTERLIAVHRAWLKKNGRESLPLWLTESGWSWPKGAGRPSLERDQESALHITMKGIEAKACGVARYMPFCLAFYEEGGIKSFSMMGREVTPLRSVAAYAQSIRVLSGKRYVGDLAEVTAPIVRARIFSDEKPAVSNERLIILYTEKVEPTQSVALPLKISRIEGIDGRSLSLTADGQIPIPDGLTYVWANEGTVNPDTAAMKLLHSSRQPTPVAVKTSSIVLQYILDPGQVSYSSTCYLLKTERASQMSITVRVHNLSQRNAHLNLSAQLPGEGAVKIPYQKADVPARGTSDVTWIVDARNIWKTPQSQPILISAVTFDGTPPQPLAIPLLVEAPLETYFPLYSRRTALPISNVKSWVQNIAPRGSFYIEKAAPSGVKMKVAFQTGDRWSYPKFLILPGVMDHADGFLLRARVEKNALIRMAIYKASGTAFLTADSLFPADNQWHVVYVPFHRFEPNQEATHQESGDWKPSDITAISVGLNDQSKDQTNTIDLSDVIIVESKK